MPANITRLSSESIPSTLHQQDRPSPHPLLPEALERCDEPILWNQLADMAAHEKTQDQLSEIVSRLQFIAEGQPQYSEIFLMPVLVSRQPSAIEAELVWASARVDVRNAIAHWFNASTALTLFPQLIPQEWISAWEPTVLRAHLERLRPNSQQNPLHFHPETLHLPDGFPRLHFVVLGVSSRLGWPEIHAPAEKLARNSLISMRDRLDPNTCDVGPWGTEFCQVMPPRLFRHAIPDGIHHWLLCICEKASFAGWVIHMDPLRSDRISITLRFQDAAIADTQLVLRLHQIGNAGLQQILCSLTSLAPNLDVPTDLAH